MYISSPSGRGPALTADPKRNENAKIDTEIDAIIPTASPTSKFLSFREDQTVNIVESTPRKRPPAWPHHRTPQKANNIGNGNAAAEPGIVSRNRLTNAETIAAAESAIKPGKGSLTIEAPKKTANPSVDRSSSPIKTEVGVRSLFIAKVCIVVERQQAVTLVRPWFQ
jgi:hypothetical protein